MPDFSAHGLDRSDMALQGAVTALYALQAAMMALLDTALIKTGHSTHLGRPAVGTQWTHQCQRAFKTKSKH